MKRFLMLMVIAVFAIGLVACGGQKKAEQKAPAKTEMAKPDTTHQDTTAAKADTTQKAAEQK